MGSKGTAGILLSLALLSLPTTAAAETSPRNPVLKAGLVERVGRIPNGLYRFIYGERVVKLMALKDHPGVFQIGNALGYLQRLSRADQVALLESIDRDAEIQAILASSYTPQGPAPDVDVFDIDTIAQARYEPEDTRLL